MGYSIRYAAFVGLVVLVSLVGPCLADSWLLYSSSVDDPINETDGDAGEYWGWNTALYWNPSEFSPANDGMYVRIETNSHSDANAYWFDWVGTPHVNVYASSSPGNHAARASWAWSGVPGSSPATTV
jgi:hypothetical protein